jgi:hypothetical protein
LPRRQRERRKANRDDNRRHGGERPGLAAATRRQNGDVAGHRLDGRAIGCAAIAQPALDEVLEVVAHRRSSAA